MTEARDSTRQRSKPYRSDPEYQRQRRAAIREHHPDRGGSDAALIAALRELDERWERQSSRRGLLRGGRVDPDLDGTSHESWREGRRGSWREGFPDELWEELRYGVRDTWREAAARTRNAAKNNTVFAQRTWRNAARRNVTGLVSHLSTEVRSRLPRDFPGARRFTETKRPPNRPEGQL